MKEDSTMPEQDFFRDTWVRYLGYANEVGESFRGVVPRFVVNWSYKVAFAYVAADTIAKSWKMTIKDPNPAKILATAGDAFIWQTLASVVIPGFTINRICAFSGKALASKAPKLDRRVRAGLVIAAGLASIPIIVHPIDNATTLFMDYTYRKWFPCAKP